MEMKNEFKWTKGKKVEKKHYHIALGICELLWLKRLTRELEDYYKRSYEVIL